MERGCVVKHILFIDGRDEAIFGCIKCDFNLLIFNGAILYY